MLSRRVAGPAVTHGRSQLQFCSTLAAFQRLRFRIGQCGLPGALAGQPQRQGQAHFGFAVALVAAGAVGLGGQLQRYGLCCPGRCRAACGLRGFAPQGADCASGWRCQACSNRAWSVSGAVPGLAVWACAAPPSSAQPSAITTSAAMGVCCRCFVGCIRFLCSGRGHRLKSARCDGWRRRSAVHARQQQDAHRYCQGRQVSNIIRKRNGATQAPASPLRRRRTSWDVQVA